MFAKEKLYAQMGLQRSRADKRLKKRWANVPKKPENTFFKHVRYKEHCNLNVFLIFSTFPTDGILVLWSRLKILPIETKGMSVRFLIR